MNSIFDAQGIWASVEPQQLGPVQRRGQAAMGATAMKDGRFEHVPIRNYGPRPRDPEPQERPPIPPAQQVDWTQYDEDDSFEVVSDVADEEQLPQPDKRLQHEGCHGAMAIPPGGDGNGDRDDPGRRERVRDYVPDPPAAEEEEPRRPVGILRMALHT